MKTRSSVPYRPTEAEIRQLAHEMYVRSGWIPGRDLDNWLAAEAYLIAHPPSHTADPNAATEAGLPAAEAPPLRKSA
jgi:hypothetical protein